MDKAKSLFDHQMEFLKLEVDTINTSIRQIDEILKNIKQWAITVWAAAVGGALSRPELTKYIVLTAVIPVLFWWVDALFKSTQRRFIYRTLMIKDFLNDGRLERSIEAGKLENFEVLNPAARKKPGEPPDKDLIKFIAIGLTMRLKTTSALYLGLVTLSVVMWAAGVIFGLIR